MTEADRHCRCCEVNGNRSGLTGRFAGWHKIPVAHCRRSRLTAPVEKTKDEGKYRRQREERIDRIHLSLELPVARRENARAPRIDRVHSRGARPKAAFGGRGEKSHSVARAAIIHLPSKSACNRCIRVGRRFAPRETRSVRAGGKERTQAALFVLGGVPLS